MDWKILLSSFGLVFLAELGDKTQLTTMMLTARSNAPAFVFAGAAAALVLSALLGTVFGEALDKVVPQSLIQVGAGVAFIGVGTFLLLNRG